MDGAPACPFVAFGDDREARSTSPDHRHRCFAESPPAPRAVAHQEAYCLSSAFPVCPTFQDWARREAAHARGAGDRAETALSASRAAGWRTTRRRSRPRPLPAIRPIRRSDATRRAIGPRRHRGPPARRVRPAPPAASAPPALERVERRRPPSRPPRSPCRALDRGPEGPPGARRIVFAGGSALATRGRRAVRPPRMPRRRREPPAVRPTLGPPRRRAPHDSPDGARRASSPAPRAHDPPRPGPRLSRRDDAGDGHRSRRPDLRATSSPARPSNGASPRGLSRPSRASGPGGAAEPAQGPRPGRGARDRRARPVHAAGPARSAACSSRGSPGAGGSVGACARPPP